MLAKIPVWVDRMQRMGKFGRFGTLLLMVGALMLLANGGNILAGAERATTPMPASTVAAHRRVQAAAAKLPLRFEENVGQVNGPEARDVRYISRGSAYSLFLTSSEAVLVLRQHAKDATGKNSPAVMRLRLSGTRQAPEITGQGALPGRSNYLIGNDPSQWHTGVANFSRVAENGVYPGIDLVYHGNQGQLEYDFDVAPNSDPKAIRLAISGSDSLRVDASGDLVVKLDGGELRFRQPVAYQKLDSGLQRLIPVRYSLQGKNEVTFSLAAYDHHQPLVIDPILSYSTYLGGTGIDGANGIAVAPDGTAFIAGGTFSADFPTQHPLQPNVGGPNDFPQDAFISKLSADGSTLLYSTYLGGKNQDVANAIAVDAAGEAFVTGTTLSPNFPVTTGAFDTECGGDAACGATWNTNGLIVSNAFVAKLNVAGSGLVYSTFLGYYENVQGLGIAVDSALNAYVTGSTSPNFDPTVIITPPNVPPPPFPIVGGFETTYDNVGTEYGGSGTNAFITKFNALGTGILYSSYLGGDDQSIGNGIAVNNLGTAYLTGLTYSPNFPVKTPTVQGTYSGAGSAFVSEVATTATGAASLIYSTYLGGAGLTRGNAIALDSNGNVYVAGTTTSTAAQLHFTPPAGAFQTDCSLDSVSVCEGDAFVAKLTPTNPGATSLVYFTYLGGALADSATGIAIDTSFNAYVTGSTVSPNFPIQGAVFQPTYGGGNADAFVTEVNPAGSALIYSTFLGGSNTDTGAGIAVDVTGNAYVTGQTCSIDFPLASPLQPEPGGDCDAFVSKVIPSGGVALSPAGLIFPNQLLSTTSVAQTITLSNGGNVPVTGISISITGADIADFAQTNTCGTQISALAQCTISVTFSPQATGTRTAQITATDSGGTQVADLTGTGGSTPIVTISPTSLPFNNQSVGVASAPQTIQISNTGTAPLTITSTVTSGDYSIQSSTCGATLQATTPPSTCILNVVFTPTTTGSSVGSLTITDNAPNSPQVILLTGSGVLQPSVSLSASAIAFGSQTVNLVSSPQTVSLTNIGSAPLSIASITATTGFGVSNTCSSPIAPQATCLINVTFDPTAPGAAVGSVTVTDNAANSPQTITLSGTGVTVPIANLSPASLNFSTSQAVGTTSGSIPVTLTNTGSAALVIGGISTSANFGSTNNCGASVAAGNSCTINVTFSPTAVGNLYGTLTVADNNSGSPASTQIVPLAGIGIGSPSVSLSSTTLNYGSQLLNTTSSVQTVTVTNSGTSSLTINSITASAPFAQTSTCGAPVAVNGICTISVTFTPTSAGGAVGTVTLVDNAGNSPQVISLTGTGTTAPNAVVSPTTWSFPAQGLGSTSAATTITLSNTGSATLVISNITASGDFATTNTCGASVAAGANCSIAVTFTPTAVGNRYGSLTVTDNSNGAAGSTQVVALEGIGQGAPIASLSTTTLTFAAQALGTSSAAVPVTLTNSGTTSLTITSIVPSGDFSQTNNCPATLGTGASCLINVSFAPSVVGTRTGSLTITDSAPNSPQVVTLTGAGADFGVTVTPASTTVVAGGSTSVTITVNSVSGFNSAVVLSCSGTPSLSTCAASPSSVTPSGSGAATSTLNITTTRRSAVPPGGLPRLPGSGLPTGLWVWFLAALLLLSFAVWTKRGNRPQWNWAILVLTALWLASFAACGNGGVGYVNTTGTPAGSYTITVTGSSAGLTHQTTVTLNVQ